MDQNRVQNMNPSPRTIFGQRTANSSHIHCEISLGILLKMMLQTFFINQLLELMEKIDQNRSKNGSKS